MSNSVQNIWLHPRIPPRAHLSRNLVLAFAAALALLWIAAWVSVSAPMVAAMQHLRSNAARAHRAPLQSPPRASTNLATAAPLKRSPACAAPLQGLAKA